MILIPSDVVEQELNRSGGRQWKPLPEGWYVATLDTSNLGDLAGPDESQRFPGAVFKIATEDENGGERTEDIRKDLFIGDVVRIAKVLGMVKPGKDLQVDPNNFDGVKIGIRIYHVTQPSKNQPGRTMTFYRIAEYVEPSEVEVG